MDIYIDIADCSIFVCCTCNLHISATIRLNDDGTTQDVVAIYEEINDYY